VIGFCGKPAPFTILRRATVEWGGTALLDFATERDVITMSGDSGLSKIRVQHKGLRRSQINDVKARPNTVFRVDVSTK